MDEELLASVREKYPQYSDLSDQQLARALHGKFYSDMAWEDFAGRVGLGQQQGSAPPEAPVQQQAANRFMPSLSGGPSPSEFIRMVRGPVSDEISGALAGLRAMWPGGQSPREAYREAASAERENVARLRQEHPRPAIAAALAPALLPIGVGAHAVRGGAGLIGAGLRGGAVGVGEAGALGVAEAEGSLGERASQTARAPLPLAVGATAGVGGGMVAPLANLVRLRRAGRGSRTGRELARRAGLDDDAISVVDDLEARRRAVSDEMYGPLDEAYGSFQDEGLEAFLARPDVEPFARRATNPDGSLNFRGLQRIRSRLRGSPEVRDEALAERLDELMKSRFEGLADADKAYAEAMGLVNAFDEGRKFANKGSLEIHRATRGLSDAERLQFRQGQLSRILQSLERREGGALSWFRDFMDAGPETERVVRGLFDDEDDYRRFIREVVNPEQSAEFTMRAVRRWAPRLLTALAGGGAALGGAKAMGLFDGSP